MIVVTGATGKLGQHVVAQLLEKLPASELAVAVRNPAKASALAARGVQVREADYSRPETLRAALAGASKVLLISSSEVGQRAAQHAAVLQAARSAEVGLLAYTSILHGERSPLLLAAEHVATENAIKASGLAHVFLRNGWYLENYTEQLAAALQHARGASQPLPARILQRPPWPCLRAQGMRARPTSSPAMRLSAWDSWRRRSRGRPARPSGTTTFRPTNTG
jgi:uncharacterized protein YbjT (DUF2867 family)